MGFNLLYILEPLAVVIPSVAKPIVPITTRQKTIFTAAALFIYLMCSQIPLYGITRYQNSDPFYWTRIILASSQGTLMELGISPIISAGWALQFAGLTGLYKVDQNSKRDVFIYEGLQKTLGLIFAFGSAVGQIWYGSYGSIQTLGLTGIILLIIQLVAASLIVLLLDDMLSNGYGLGSGISLFLLANIAQSIFWKLFSPITLSTEFGIQFEGSFICLIHFLLTKPSKSTAIYLAFTRTSAPNLTSLLGTIFIFFIVIYLQGMHTNITLIHQTSKGYKYDFKVKLFFTSNISVILQSMIASHFYSLSEILYSRFKGVFWIQLLGVWKDDKCIGGLSWWISPPQNLAEFLLYPARGVIYIIFVCSLCAAFSQFWLVVSHSTPSELAKQFRDQQLTLPGYRDQSVYSRLNKQITTASMLGGVIIGLLSIFGDLIDVIGSSTGILLSVNIIYGYFSKYAWEKTEKGIRFY